MNGLTTDRFGTSGYPLYVRKLDKKSSWGDGSDPGDARLDRVLMSLFPPNEMKYSLYLLRSDTDLARVVVGLNSYRDRLNDKVDLIAFTGPELQAAEISFDDALGDTNCIAANKLHTDVSAVTRDSYERLCKAAFDINRPAVRIGKVEAKEMVAQLRDFGCHAFEQSAPCPCNDEPLV